MNSYAYQKRIRQGGFTLIEMLIYLAIFMVVTTASVTLLLSLDDFIDQYRLETRLYRSGTNVMEQVLLAARQADSVDVINTIEDSPSTGKLTVESAATTTAFTFDSGDIELEINGTEYGAMTSSAVTVDSFTVYYYDSGESEFVRVRLELSTASNGSSKSLTLYGGTVIRGSI